MILKRGSTAVAKQPSVTCTEKFFALSRSHAGTPEDVEGVIGGVLLTLPFYKHIFAWMGAHPAGVSFHLPLQQIPRHLDWRPSAYAHVIIPGDC